MKLLKFNPRKSKAQAIVEFAIVLPILLLVVYGLIETGRLLFIYSSVNNATRQAARYGSTSGLGPNGVPRFQDCAEIRAAAQKSDFLDAFDDATITISYDNGPGTSSYDTCDGAADGGVSPSQGDRVVVSIDADYNTIVPNIVPFLSRTVAGGNPIVAESSRTLLLTISIAPPKENTVTLITSDMPDPSEIGQYVTVSVTVTANTTPTGTVTITGAEEGCSLTLSGGSGSCNVRFLSIGEKTLTATYGGDTTHNPSGDTESHTVNPASTTTVITADTPDPSQPNQAVNVSVTVSSAWGTPTGTVDITGADTNCTITLPNTNCNVNFTSSGPRTLIATYNGDAEHDTSNDDENHTVVLPGATITSITSASPDPSNIGQAVTVNVTVTSSTTPTGTVAITGADSNCSFTLTNGAGSCTVTFNSVGNKTLTATYTPATTDHTGSSDTESHTVVLPATITTITVPPTSSTGQNVTVTVAVTNVPGGSTIIPTGTVTITGQNPGEGCTTPITLVNGAGSCIIVFSSTGSKTLTATYSGDSSHATSSASANHTVTTPPISGCNTVTVGLLQQTNGAMTMTINNPLTQFLQIGNITVTWNHDRGYKGAGGDKSLILQSVSLGSVFWTGNENGPTYTIIPALPIFIPPGPSTLVFNFHQEFGQWDNTEQVTINLSTPGCEGVILFQNQH